MNISENVIPLSYKDLGSTIRTVFLENEKYTFDKHVPTLEVDGKYVGDLFDMTIFEPRAGQAPVIYHTFSPYDVVSGKTSQYGTIFQAAELLFAAETTPFVEQRTAVMAPLVMISLGITQLAGKRVLFVGTGKVATRSLAAFKEYFPELAQVYFINAGSAAEIFMQTAKDLGIAAERGDLQAVGSYDVIVCHASAKEPILTPEILASIKPGAFIASFASEDHAELSPGYYDTADVRVIVDWQQTTSEAVDLQAALAAGAAKADDVVKLQDVFNESSQRENGKKFTVYRSHGTPMQNLAFLQLLNPKR